MIRHPPGPPPEGYRWVYFDSDGIGIVPDTVPCCTYRDHFGDPEVCPCPDHPLSALHFLGQPGTEEKQ